MPNFLPGESFGIPDFLRKRKSPIERALESMPLPSPQAPMPDDNPMMPTRRQRLEEEVAAMDQPLTGKQKLIEGLKVGVPLALAGIFGGESGLSGGAAGLNEALTAQNLRKENRRKSLLEDIGKERGYEQDTQMQQDRYGLQRELEQMQQEGQNARTAADIFSREKIAGMQKPQNIDPLSTQGIEARLQFERGKPQPVTTRSIDPLSPEGINARLQFERGKPQTTAPRNIDPLSPEGIKARLDFENKKPKTGTEDTTGTSGYQAERAQRIIDSVDELLPQVDHTTVGVGTDLAANIPIVGQNARDFRAQLETLKAGIITNELQQMRADSTTGGALGQVSDRESAFLSSALGALDPRQRPEVFKGQLNKIKESIQRWQAAKGLKLGGARGSTQGPPQSDWPPLGTVKNGYVYIGGNPANPTSWKAQ